MSGRHLRRLLLAFAIVNGTLYSCFLPLWEGFDEPFHYAYIQSLSQGRLPVFRKAKVSAEIYASFANVPLSRFLSGSTGGCSFEEWFTLPVNERQTRLARRVDPALRQIPSSLDNYEAQQAPLAYLLLVPFDATLSRVALRWRVLVLRLLLTIPSTLMIWYGVSKLSRELHIPKPFALAATACIFGSQMLWATVAHIGNDALAVPLTLLFLLWLGIAVRTRRPRHLLIWSAVFAAGLLNKAYFLAFLPVFFAYIIVELSRRRVMACIALLIPCLIAGPWYWHNHTLYGSFSGTQQSVAGIGFEQVLEAIPKIPWLKGTLPFLHWSLWTGNWSFLSFSKTTLNVELILIALALLLYFCRFRGFSASEWWQFAACACFLAGLAYQTCATYIHTHGASLFAEPWYWQGVVCFLWVLAFRGLAQSGRIARCLAVATLLVSAWIAIVTYIGKLFPLYGSGFERATLGRVWTWWSGHPAQDLNLVALAPAAVLYLLLSLFLLIVSAQTILLVRQLVRCHPD